MPNKHYDNIFLRHSTHTAAPWLVKAGEKERRIIQGLHQEPIGYINQLGNPVINGDQYRANCNLIQHAPQLLAALKEIAVIIENANSTSNTLHNRPHYMNEAFPDTTKLQQLIQRAESITLEEDPDNE